MATTTFTITHERASDFTVASNARLPQVISRMMNFLQGGVAGNFSIQSIELSQDAAAGTVTLSGVDGVAATGSYALNNVGGDRAGGLVTLTNVGGTAASNTVTLGGGSGDVTIVTDGTSVGPVAFNTSDAQTALDAITALNANGTFAAKATASSGGSGIITITWDTKGTVGNSKTLTASRTAGTVTVGGNGTTLGGGAQGSVTVTLNGTAVVTDTTNLTDTAAAVAVSEAIEADGTLGNLVTAVEDGTDATISWDAKGVAGNVSLTAATATGTAVPSGATLTGGVDGAVTLVINGTSVGPVNTTNLSDTAAATAVAAAIEADGTLGPLLAAVGSTTNVSLTWGTKGTVGNAVTLAAGVSATGTATRSGATLSGGQNNTVTVTVGGEAVATSTTTLSNSAAATAVAAALNANATVADYVTASAASNVVTLTAVAAGEEGNGISLVAATTNGTATASGATLSGGSSTTHTR